MTAEPKELPIYVITSSNWTMEVQMDEYNSNFDIESQIMEAGTIAVEVFKGIKDKPFIQMNPDSGNDEPYMGTTMLIHPKGADPDDAAVVFTHVCYANVGLYKESFELQKTLEKQIEDIQKSQLEKELQRKKEHDQSLQMFDELKKELAAKKKIKKKKKTDDEDDAI